MNDTLHLPERVDWIGLSSVLHPRQHSIGYMGREMVFTGQKTQPRVSKY